MTNPLCECGCGERVTKPTNRYINGHNCRGKVGQFKGKKHTKETRAKMSKTHTENPQITRSMLGKKHTKETRKKMSESTKGQIPWNKGIPNCHSLETLKKIRDANTKNGIWGSKEASERYCPMFRNKQFRKIIYRRDGYTCLICGCTRQLNLKLHGHYNLTIHHINHNKKDCDIRNCISTCVRCNSHVENRKVKKYYESYLSELVNYLYY